MSKPQEVTVTLEAGEYSGVQHEGFVIERKGEYMTFAFNDEYGPIEDAIFVDSFNEAKALALDSKGSTVKKAKRLIVDFYEVE